MNSLDTEDDEPNDSKTLKNNTCTCEYCDFKYVLYKIHRLLMLYKKKWFCYANSFFASHFCWNEIIPCAVAPF